MKITITTLVIIEDMEVQDVIHSFNEDPAKAKQEIIDQVNDIYSDGTESYTTMEEVLDSFTFKVGGHHKAKPTSNPKRYPLTEVEP